MTTLPPSGCRGMGETEAGPGSRGRTGPTLSCGPALDNWPALLNPSVISAVRAPASAARSPIVEGSYWGRGFGWPIDPSCFA